MSGPTPLAALARRHDPDRFLCSLFAPADRRETLFLLLAFNHEIARAREVTREPLLALIRLRWWREVVDGAVRPHEVARPLAEALDAGLLARDDLRAMIDGRTSEAEPSLPRLADFRQYVLGTAGVLAVAAGRVLGAEPGTLDRLRALGGAYGVAGQMRSVAALARQGRCLLPADLLAAHGLTPEAVAGRPGDPRLGPVLATLAEWGRALLRDGGGRFRREDIAAALPAVLARRDLRRPAMSDPTPRALGARLAVAAAAARRTV